MQSTIVEIETEALESIEQAFDSVVLEQITIKYLGRKGILTGFLRNISSLSETERPDAGKNANILKEKLEKAIQTRQLKIEAQIDEDFQGIDVTLPGRFTRRGSFHPITQVAGEISDIFLRLGFDIAESPEVETDYYNFEALNIPKYHPARDMQDTFYVSENIVLRTHTSPSQPRVMEKTKPPVRIISPGKVFRCDSDITHTPMFHQVEGLMVDKNISFGDLKGIDRKSVV